MPAASSYSKAYPSRTHGEELMRSRVWSGPLGHVETRNEACTRRRHRPFWCNDVHQGWLTCGSRSKYLRISGIPIKVQVNDGKVHPITGHESPEGEYRYSSTLSLTSALDGGGWSTPRPGRFTPGKQTRCPLYRRLGVTQDPSGRVRKISPLPGFDRRPSYP
jgi:hypothetical protein